MKSVSPGTLTVKEDVSEISNKKISRDIERQTEREREKERQRERATE